MKSDPPNRDHWSQRGSAAEAPPSNGSIGYVQASGYQDKAILLPVDLSERDR